MIAAVWLFFLTGAFPLVRAWRANRRASPGHALGRAVAAWAAGGGLMRLAAASGPVPGLTPARYLALCLTACAGVAVFGARRPGVAAWNFVLLGLLAVLLLPLAEGLVLGAQTLDGLRLG